MRPTTGLNLAMRLEVSSELKPWANKTVQTARQLLKLNSPSTANWTVAEPISSQLN